MIIIYFIICILCFWCSTRLQIETSAIIRIWKHHCMRFFFLQFNVSRLSQSLDWWLSLSSLSRLLVLSLSWQTEQADGWLPLCRLSRPVFGRPQKDCHTYFLMCGLAANHKSYDMFINVIFQHSTNLPENYKRHTSWNTAHHSLTIQKKIHKIQQSRQGTSSGWSIDRQSNNMSTSIDKNNCSR